MHQWTFLELAKRVLEDEKKPLSPEEIWNLAVTKGYDINLGSQGKTPLATLGARLYVDVKRGLASPFVSTDSRPKRFFLRSLLTERSEQKILEAAQAPVIVKKKIEYLEKDLHPLLAFYGYHYMRAYLKTIHHSKSDKKEYGEWVHPDMGA